MIAIREPWIESASVLPQLRGLVEDGAYVFLPGADPKLTAALLERRRRGQIGRDCEAIQAAESRLAALHTYFPEIDAELSDLLVDCRTALLRKVE